jgi:hypothetical protein
VEYLAVVVVVALGLAAVGVWLASTSRPAGDGPAAVVDRAWSGLDRIAAPGSGTEVRTPGPFRRAVRSVARAVQTGSDIAATGVASLGLGVGDGVRATLDAFLADPAGTLVGGGGAAAALAHDPLGVTRAQLDAALAYARALRELPPREAYRRFMRDLGEAGADLAITRGKQLAVRSLIRAARRRSALPPDSGRRSR